ncbi:hypothetical protein SPRG_19356 [Saprolegnia parasitica CBS 223.65]|uniref:Uncharacterized protein n=1 Tax=Saprolegnia parasitica (strain CBS 223.65) TaxID=695850 RepID=A0A067CSW5_SAPPC|nr:hypothetical protein SPRG_19356 [Saprolegnia parasitica CBS 223.65]KDO33779.1 hypothetical protein SPRG_19356 [Saprolegnia parasitica CBS 223.65]|eukprot:XP_012195760.1 hypothetical protein SPRG_19356 [Saprolegnia parasitica CBS 223.65]
MSLAPTRWRRTCTETWFLFDDPPRTSRTITTMCYSLSAAAGPTHSWNGSRTSRLLNCGRPVVRSCSYSQQWDRSSRRARFFYHGQYAFSSRFKQPE